MIYFSAKTAAGNNEKMVKKRGGRWRSFLLREEIEMQMQMQVTQCKWKRI